MKRTLLIVALSLLLAGCGEVVAPVATPPTTVPTLPYNPPTYTTDTPPTPIPSPTATPVAQLVTMESDVHAYDTAHFGVYFVEYQTLVRDTAADFTSVEWDCFPPQPPDHPHAFFGVNVGRQKGTISYDGHTLRLVPQAGSAEVGTINADGTWSMLETETSIHFMYRVATGSPEGLIKQYDGAPCTPSE